MNLVFSYTRISDVVDGTVPLNGFVFTIRKIKRPLRATVPQQVDNYIYLHIYIACIICDNCSGVFCVFLLFLIMGNIMLDTNGIPMYTKCD